MKKRAIIFTAILLLAAVLTMGVTYTSQIVKGQLIWFIHGKPESYIEIPRIQFIEHTVRTGEGSCLFANGIPIGMALPGDCQGMKMEFTYGVTPDSFPTGKIAHGLMLKMTMDEKWLSVLKPYNAVVRGASIQAVSEDSVGGRVEGLYVNAKAEGTAELQGYYSGVTSAGLVAMQARTEIQSNATIVTPAVAGLFIHHYSKAASSVSGDYRAIQINQPQLGAAATMDGEEFGIYFCDDLTTGTEYTYAFGFDTNLEGSIAHYQANQSPAGMSFTTVDGYIKVEIDGQPLYIYLWDTAW